jgi:hypothetical protein
MSMTRHISNQDTDHLISQIVRFDWASDVAMVVEDEN